MDRTRAELIGPLLLQELRREAHQERLSASAETALASGGSTVAELGRLLVRVGRRLEERGRPRPVAAALAADTCGCGS